MDLFFQDSLDRLPKIAAAEGADRGLAQWTEAAARLPESGLAAQAKALTEDPAGRRLLEAVFANSAFLTDCMLSETAFLMDLLGRGPDAALDEVLRELDERAAAETDPQRLMPVLRLARRKLALLVALADLTGHWSLERVVEALSDFADRALSAAVGRLLVRAAERGELELAEAADPERNCGLVVLALGKLGARELNYSSDIDLIVLFDPERARYRAGRGPQEGFVRMTRDLVRILEERTGEGHVFRTDLRLRPDPGAMPLAISVESALTYYESLGQNWERAAMIKARPVAGDLAMGREFLRELQPFVWRKHLDFWAIQDIHSIKRQIYAHKGGQEIAVLGHDIKLGRGGIREIEFFAQTQQLIWGGREPELRKARTLDALAALVEAGHVAEETAADLGSAYRYLRGLEHRLQMIADQQTQRLPDDEAGLARIAAFMGCDGTDGFREALLGALRKVEDHYAELFEESPALATSGNLVFTGGEPEPGTLKTLNEMGFEDGARVFGLVRAWHHGRHRATRSTRARQLLTEIMPSLLEALGKTRQPDLALAKFDEFLSGLPAGVQLFSLLHANPSLLDLLAEIMGGAPALADRLSRNPALLDAVLTQGFFDHIPEREELEAELAATLEQARDFQDVLDLSRRWANDRRFQVGVHMLRGTSDVEETGRALSDIADTVLGGLYGPVLEEFARNHGRVPGGGLAVVAFGKLGAREMSVSSDLDLVFVYDSGSTERDAAEPESDGPKALPASQYFARLAQRYIGALTAMTGEGQLYEIDMRLRPSGNKGPIAATLAGWRRYQETEAWTWEHMALTRARVVTGSPELRRAIEETIRDVICRQRDPNKLLAEVANMRARVEREHPAKTIWSVKYLRGGLMDLEFLAQYLVLRHAPEHPEILDGATAAVFAKAARAGFIGSTLAQRLIAATRLMREVQGMLRLTAAPAFDADSGSASLQAMLTRATGMESFSALRDALVTQAQIAHEVFVETIEEPAKALAAEGAGNGDAKASETDRRAAP